jgi:hypothetical protein
MGKAGRHFVEKERNWKRSVAAYAPVYAHFAGAKVKR